MSLFLYICIQNNLFIYDRCIKNTKPLKYEKALMYSSTYWLRNNGGIWYMNCLGIIGWRERERERERERNERQWKRDEMLYLLQYWIKRSLLHHYVQREMSRDNFLGLQFGCMVFSVYWVSG